MTITMDRRKNMSGFISQIKSLEQKLSELRAMFEVFSFPKLNGDGDHHAPHKRIDLSKLSKQEKKILGLMGSGKSNSQIATHLKLSKRTVETHRYNIQKKLGVSFAELRELARMKLER